MWRGAEIEPYRLEIYNEQYSILVVPGALFAYCEIS
jgi:hypothetical protein